jgi:hypothetical protein
VKIIDRTPFYNERGGISFADRTRAILKFGKSWLDEMETQKSVLPLFEKYLDRKYTLLRNVTLPGLEASIPFILVGPAGIYVSYVTDMAGMYRAKGDQWGTISANTLKPEKINLVTRTEQLARAVQLYLQREGKLDIPGVETALICTNPSIHVDSVRPIIRVVLRDALERFIISISETTPVMGQDMVIKVVDFITNPILRQTPEISPVVEKALGSPDNEIPAISTITPSSAPSLDASPAKVNQVSSSADQQPAEIFITDIPQQKIDDPSSELASTDNSPLEFDPLDPSHLLDASSPLEQEFPSPVNDPTTPSTAWPAPASLSADIDPQPGMIPLQSEISPEPYSSPLPESLFPGFVQKPIVPEPQKPLSIIRKPVSVKQWIILAAMALIWIILVGILLFFIVKDFIL